MVAVLRVTRLVDGVHLSHPEDLIDIAALVYPCHRPYFVSHPVLLPPTPIMWVLNGISRSTPEITFFFLSSIYLFLKQSFDLCSDLPELYCVTRLATFLSQLPQ